MNELLLVLLLFGFLAVASNPSPYYAAFGLVLGAVVSSLLLSKVGMTFLSLVLMLVYLGGMMVVFAYCTALAADPYPEAWGNNVVLGYMTLYFTVAVLTMFSFMGWFGWGDHIYSVLGLESTSFDWLGVSQMYDSGSWMLMISGLVLLLALFVVLEVVRGHYIGALRAV